MKLQKIEISNYGPFAEGQVVDFTQYSEDDIILITGENRDDAGMDNNGSGKTSLQDCICWLILGKVPNISSQENIIKHGENYCEVKGHFEDQEGNEYKVIRGRKLRKNRTKEYIEVYLNGEDVSSRTNSQTQDYLLELWGFSTESKGHIEEFTNTTYFPAKLVNNIVGDDVTSSDRFNLISSFLQLHKVDEVRKKLKEINREAKNRIQKISDLIGELNDEIGEGLPPLKRKMEASKERVTELETNKKALKKDIDVLEGKVDVFKLIRDLDEQKERIESKIERATEKIERTKASIEGEKLELTELTKEIQKLEEEVPTKVADKKIDKAVDHLSVGRSNLSQITLKAEELSDQLTDSLNCPSCDAHLMYVEGNLQEFNKDQVQEEHQKLKDQLLDLGDKITAMEGIVKKLRTKKKKYDEYLTDLRKKRQDLENIDNRIETKQTLLKSQKTDLEDLLQELSGVKEQLEPLAKKAGKSNKFNELQDLQSKLKSVELQINNEHQNQGSLTQLIQITEENIGKLKEATLEKKELMDKVKYPLFWDSHIDELKRWIIEGFLPELEELTSHYLSIIETGFTVRFNTVKEKKATAGEYKQEFHISIVDSSQQEREIETFSTGEAKRVAICTGFALRQLTLNKGSNNFNFIMIDEVVDSLDKTGIGEFSHLLDHIPGFKLIISHNDEVKNRFPNLIYVTKEDGSSTIKQV